MNQVAAARRENERQLCKIASQERTKLTPAHYRTSNGEKGDTAAILLPTNTNTNQKRVTGARRHRVAENGAGTRRILGAILRWPHCPHSDPLPENEVKLPSPIRLDAIDCAISPSISDCCSKLTLSIRLLRQTVHCTLPPISGKSYGSLGLPFLKREERSLFLFSQLLSMSAAARRLREFSCHLVVNREAVYFTFLRFSL